MDYEKSLRRREPDVNLQENSPSKVGLKEGFMKVMESPLDGRSHLLSIADTSAPQVRNFLRALPQELIERLTFDDLRRLGAAIHQPRAQHIVDYRLSIPLGGRRIYFRILCGWERRKLSRLIAEGQTNPWLVIAAAALTFWFMMTMTLACIAILVYFVKTAMGIDLFDGPSFLHKLFFYD